jgi:hypothetical protein
MTWWGDFDIEPGYTGHWTVGPLDLWVRNRPREWWVASNSDSEGMERAGTFASVLDPTPPESAKIERFGTTRSGNSVAVRVVGSDRPIVARPEVPLWILGDDEVTLYVATPIWFVLEAFGQKLVDLPTWRLSDTWFGDDTRSGELCYASLTSARLVAGDVTMRPRRVVTAVTIRNAAADKFLVERIALPVPELPLFVDAAGMFWTAAITVERQAAGDDAHMTQASGPGPEAPEATPLAPARVPQAKGVLVRALRKLLR